MLVVLVLFSAVTYFSSTITVVRWDDPARNTYAGLRIAETGRPTYYDANNIRIGPYFTLHGFKVRRNLTDPNFYPNHSIGLPVLIALTSLILPVPSVELYVVPILAVTGLVALFALGSMLFDRWVGLLATGLLAFDFVYWSMATENWSDVPALTFLLIGIALSLRATQRDNYPQGLLGGAMLGYACLIRYASALALIPLGLYLTVDRLRQNKSYRGFAGLVTGFGVFALLILTYNTMIFGGPFATGYSPQHSWVPWQAFSWHNFLGQSPVGGGYGAVLSALSANLHVGLCLALLGFFIMPRSKALLVVGNAAVFCGLCAFYYWPPTGLAARYLLPSFSMMFLSMAFAMIRILRLILKERSNLFAVSVLIIILVWHIPSFNESRLGLLNRNSRGQAIVSLVKELCRDTEPHAVFLSSRYHDMIILYGRRSALYYEMLVAPDPASQSYDIGEYERELVTVTNKLIEEKTPVYVIKEPENISPKNIRLRLGIIDAYSILTSYFELVEVRADPPVYRVGAPLES